MRELLKYSQFDSVKEMDEAVNEALENLPLKENERRVLWKLAQYSCVYFGVSYLKTQKLADELELSKRTIQRCLKRLSEMGVITRISKFRPLSGGFGASVTVINPISCHLDLSLREDAEKQATEHTEGDTEKKETIPSQANSEKDKYNVNKEPELDHSYLDGSIVPSSFVMAVKPFINSAKEIYCLWRKVLHAGKLYCPDLIEYDEIGARAFKATVFAKKLNKIKKSFKRYFWGVLSQMMTQEQRKMVMYEKDNFLPYNWLDS
ncbi:helix-turn-helix domain-containing protein [Pseudalkalibacillus sp. A8]|uniref:helix-turn-helix domain-containing protein n=1 Tax=Pseudalkalibacillus sp. A8 TaxID=3382641 RepID=UPI0038B5673C